MLDRFRGVNSWGAWMESKMEDGYRVEAEEISRSRRYWGDHGAADKYPEFCCGAEEPPLVAPGG